MRIGVLASGAGTNLQAILDQLHGRDGIEVVAVGSDKPGAGALARAAGAGVETEVFPRGEHATASRVTARSPSGSRVGEVELVVLAGYMQLLSPGFVAGSPAG